MPASLSIRMEERSSMAVVVDRLGVAARPIDTTMATTHDAAMTNGSFAT